MKSRPEPPGRRGQVGLSYVEVLVATVLLAWSLVPALEAVQTALFGTAVYQEVSVMEQRLRGTLETVLAEPFSAIERAAAAAGAPTVPSAYSDAPGTEHRILVYVARYDADDADGDADPFTGGDDGLLWVRVEAEGTPDAIETLTAR